MLHLTLCNVTPSPHLHSCNENIFRREQLLPHSHFNALHSDKENLIWPVSFYFSGSLVAFAGAGVIDYYKITKVTFFFFTLTMEKF